jgi:hypothetical protein
MSLAALKFGSLYLCQPSNGSDGYEEVSNDGAVVAATTAGIPNTSGMIKIIRGAGASEDSAEKLEFSCESYFSSSSTLNTFRESVVRATRNARANLQTVHFGYVNDSASYTRDSCDMRVKWGKTDRHGAAGYFRCHFTVTFTQYA